MRGCTPLACHPGNRQHANSGRELAPASKFEDHSMCFTLGSPGFGLSLLPFPCVSTTSVKSDPAKASRPAEPQIWTIVSSSQRQTVHRSLIASLYETEPMKSIAIDSAVHMASFEVTGY